MTGLTWERPVATQPRVLWAMGCMAGCIVAHALSWVAALVATEMVAGPHDDYTGYVIVAVALTPFLMVAELILSVVVSCTAKSVPCLWLSLWMSAVLTTGHLALLAIWTPR